MGQPSSVIRLLGGPPGLADCHIDLEADPCDRADAAGGRFVRATRDSVTTSFTRLQSRCVDRASAEQIAAAWRLAVFVPAGGGWGGRARRYRFEGRYRLEAARDEHGHWKLTERASDIFTSRAPLHDEWAALESAVDEAARRFATVASLLPPGPLAERALATRRAVGTCVRDAARLCAVGATVAPGWTADTAGATGHVGTTEVHALATRVLGLVDTIEVATSQLVALHLEVGHDSDPVAPVASLNAAWAELSSAG
jgi:hypothetical protein